MRIGLNALGLKNKTGGVETYIYNLVKTILDNDSQNMYFLFIGKNTKDVFSDLQKYHNLKIIVYPVNTNNSVCRVIFENSLLNLGCLRHKIQLVHHFCNYIPRIFFTKSIVTVHDLGGFFYHENYPDYKEMINYYKYMKKQLAYTFKKAVKIISISEFTKSEILKYYPNLDTNKIAVIGESFDMRKSKKISKSIKLEDFDISKPYLLLVSIIRPHKNIDFIISVFNKLKSKYNIPHQLVIAGSVQLKSDTFLNALDNSPYKDDIKYLGYVSNDILPMLYKNASCYIFPSLYEGFGIPLLEAMEYNIPVISSNQASLPEVGGDACVYFNPYDVDNTVEVINNVLSQSNNLLSDEQKKRLKYWNWDNIGNKFINLYKDMVQNEN